MDPIRRLIAERIEEKRLTLKDVSLALGKSHAYMQQYLERGVPVKLGESVRYNLAEILDLPEDRIGGRTGTTVATVTGDIPNLLIAPGMGNGSLESVQFDDEGHIHPDQLGGYWSFPDPVRSLWAHMQETYAFRAIGNSMEPTIAEGAYVFVDTTHRYPSPTDIYIVDYGDGMVVKRIELIPTSDKAKVISDNPGLSDYTVRRDDLQVFGRVVAWFQWKG